MLLPPAEHHKSFASIIKISRAITKADNIRFA